MFWPHQEMLQCTEKQREGSEQGDIEGQIIARDGQEAV